MAFQVKSVVRGVALATFVALTPLAAAQIAPEHIAAALADPARPAEDRARDADRHPAELLAFAQVEPGDHVVDFLPGGGYFTHLFANLVGPDGHVAAFVPKGAEDKYEMGARAQAAVAGRANASALIAPVLTPGLSEVDVFWTAQNYHDLHTPLLGVDAAAFNKAVFEALKPGGYYVIIDHTAQAGADVTASANSLHRIDPAVVRQEVEAAGFVFDGESRVLARSSDPRDTSVFDETIRGRTDQFAYRFRKPD